MMRFFGKLVLTLGALALWPLRPWPRVAAASVAARPGS